MAQGERMICFDLDGTLIDVRRRHYSVYHDVIATFGSRPLDEPEYWRLKRSAEPWPRLLNASGLDPRWHSRFMQEFGKAIEDPAYLAMDTLFPDALQVLSRVRRDNTCLILSLRTRFDRLRDQVSALELGHLALVLEVQPGMPGAEAKAKAVFDYSETIPLAFVGDTEVDIAAARILGCTALAVSTGLRTPRLLTAAGPDSVCDSLGEAASLIDGAC